MSMFAAEQSNGNEIFLSNKVVIGYTQAHRRQSEKNWKLHKLKKIEKKSKKLTKGQKLIENYEKSIFNAFFTPAENQVAQHEPRP